MSCSRENYKSERENIHIVGLSQKNWNGIIVKKKMDDTVLSTTTHPSLEVGIVYHKAMLRMESSRLCEPIQLAWQKNIMIVLRIKLVFSRSISGVLCSIRSMCLDGDSSMAECTTKRCECKNRGSCHAANGTCSCASGYTGVKCEKRECFVWSAMALMQTWPLSIAGNAKGPPEMGYSHILLAYFLKVNEPQRQCPF